ncbi:TonB-dependent receptor [Sphingobium sp. EM0848]|uniref:TonB-dependent receptor n=1 Tax=Sphingobium sp. EM0848 TaxID=2743473 RepID=UPI00159BFC46|nr:TonB-dependent receptor [Sphingobium sp. EM0848]
MKHVLIRALGTISMASTFALSGLAHGQTAAEQDGSAAPLGVGDIIVTAQRRAENINSIPQAISAVGGEELQNRQITALDEVRALVPDLKAASSYGTTLASAFTIRGIGPANQYNLNVQQPVGTYMDEIYQTYLPAPGVQMFDLARVEVLKGPQGTLYGRNTTGGAVSFISNDPKLAKGEMNGYVRLGYGSFNRFLTEAASDITFIDDVLGLRLAVFRESQHGFIRNVGTSGPRYYGDSTSTQGRATLLFRPDDTTDIELKFYANDFDGTISSGFSDGILPGHTNFGGYSRSGLSNREAELSYNRDPEASSWQSGLTINKTLGDVKMTSITSYQKSKSILRNDCDGSPSDLCIANFASRGDQFSQDVRGQLKNDLLTLTAGAFYAKDSFDLTSNVGFAGTTFLENSFEQDRRTYGAFADATIAVADSFELTGGVRQTWDRTRISKMRTLLLDALYGDPIGMTIPSFGPYVPNSYYPDVTRKSDGLSGRAIATYKFNGSMIYASYSHGYRNGAFNGVQFFSPAELSYVGPEKVDNFELGTKLRLAGGDVQLNITGYYTKIKNQQVLTQFNIPATPTSPGISYPGLTGLDGRVYGVEAQANARLSSRLNASFSLSALNSRYDNGPDQIVNSWNVGGNRFPSAPKFSAVGGVQYALINEGDRKLTIDTNISYSSQIFFDPENGETSLGKLLVEGQKAYALVDANLTYSTGHITLGAYVRNLANKLYYSQGQNTEQSFGNDLNWRGRPRSIGVTAKLDF